MMPISFFVSGVPKSMSVGTTFAFKRNGVMTHVQGRRNTDWATLVAQIGRDHAPPVLLNEPLAFHATFYVPRPQALAKKATAFPIKRPDVDGLVHKLTDRFNGVFWADDSCIVDLHVQKRYATATMAPGVLIRIERVVAAPKPEPQQQPLITASV